MRADRVPFAIVAFLGFIALLPVWVWFMNESFVLPNKDSFLATLILPAALLLFITSWIKPDLANTTMIALMVLILIVLFPWLLYSTELGTTVLTEYDVASYIIQLIVVTIFLMVVISFGMRRIHGPS